jgi:hypothetical protein
MYAEIIGCVECDGEEWETLGGCDKVTFDGDLTLNTVTSGLFALLAAKAL